MTVLLGTIELRGVQELVVEESRTLVEQRVPGLSGSVFQDLGREPVSIVLTGILYGKSVHDDLEALRAAHARGEPLAFASDAIVGSELTEVVIDSLRVRQRAGYRLQYGYWMRVREFIVPPQSVAAALADVDQSIAADAASWNADSVTAAGVLQDPAALPGALEADPGVLGSLEIGELATSVTDNAGGLLDGGFGEVMSALGSVDVVAAAGLIQELATTDSFGDLVGSLSGEHAHALLGSLGAASPDSVNGFFDAVAESDGIGDFMGKLAKEGLDLPIDFELASALVRTFAGGYEFVKQAEKVGRRAQAVARILGDVDPFAPLRSLQEGRR